MLNPTAMCQLSSPPLSPQESECYEPSLAKRNSTSSSHGKPRSRFSDIEDAIICEGVARGLTWGQISSQLPHRKRATCFNRYRTLQGIRKSRKRSLPDMRSPPITPPHSSWLSHHTPKQESPYHPYARHNSYPQLPALVAPLPKRLTNPYPDRLH